MTLSVLGEMRVSVRRVRRHSRPCRYNSSFLVSSANMTVLSSVYVRFVTVKRDLGKLSGIAEKRLLAARPRVS